MTPQEQQLLDGLIERVSQTRPAGKDAEAEQRIQQSLGRDPDALYVLAQTVLVQQYALDQAQKQLAEARDQIANLQQRQAPPPEQHTSFLGSIFGSHPAPPPAPQFPPQSQYAPVSYGQPGYGQPAYVTAPQSSGIFGGGGGGFGGGGFLQGAMQTAAGVAAGELAFRGIEDLMHGFGHSAGYGSDRMMGGNFDRPEVVNNYYGDRDRGGDSFGDRLQAADGSSGLSSDVEDRRRGLMDDSSLDGSASDNDQFDDTNSVGNDDSGASDDSSDFSSNDDSSDFGSSDDNS